MEKIVAYTNPASPVTEAYRTLCTTMLAGLGEKKLIEVAGVNANGSTGLVAANLAVAMAQAGKRTLLMDCNLRNPKQHEIFNLNNRGLTDRIKTGENFKTFVQITPQLNLTVLTSGAMVANSAEILLSETMQSILTEAKETYDIVLLDVPATESSSDAVVLGTKTDGVLFVFTNKEDKVEQAQKSKEMFLQAGVPILGCVLNRVSV